MSAKCKCPIFVHISVPRENRAEYMRSMYGMLGVHEWMVRCTLNPFSISHQHQVRVCRSVCLNMCMCCVRFGCDHRFVVHMQWCQSHTSRLHAQRPFWTDKLWFIFSIQMLWLNAPNVCLCNFIGLSATRMVVALCILCVHVCVHQCLFVRVYRSRHGHAVPCYCIYDIEALGCY